MLLVIAMPQSQRHEHQQRQKNSHSPPLLRVCADGLQGGNTNNQQGG